MKREAKSADPKQQHLRDRKANWNRAAKDFIAKLISFKKGLNGRGDSRMGLPPSDIKNPIPQETINFLSEVSSYYQLLAEEALRISEEQHQYSETRRKPADQKVATASKKEAYIVLGDNKLDTLIASTPTEQERGLMFIDPPAPVMSFIYSRPQLNKFWMKQTKAPLDIIFSCNGRITNICVGEPYSLRLIGDDNPSDLVIEMPLGTCEKMGIKIGDPVKLEY